MPSEWMNTTNTVSGNRSISMVFDCKSAAVSEVENVVLITLNIVERSCAAGVARAHVLMLRAQNYAFYFDLRASSALKHCLHCHKAMPNHAMQSAMMAMLLAKLQKVTKAAACAWSKWSVCFVLMCCSSRSL